MNVLIVGSFPANEQDIENDDDLKQNFEAFQESCKELGKALAASGATIFVGSDRPVDADTYVVEGVNQAPLNANKKQHSLVIYTPDDWQRADPPFSDRLAELPNISADYWLVPGPWVKSTNSMMRRANVIIVIGGRGATLQAGMAAPALGKPPVAIPAFGGAGEQVFDALHWSYLTAGLGGAQLDSLRQPFRSPERAQQVVDFSLQLSKRNPFQTKTGIRWRFAMLAVALVLIALWVRVLGLGAERARQLSKQTASSNQPADKDQAVPEKSNGAAKPNTGASTPSRGSQSKQDGKDQKGNEANNNNDGGDRDKKDTTKPNKNAGKKKDEKGDRTNQGDPSDVEKEGNQPDKKVESGRNQDNNGGGGGDPTGAKKDPKTSETNGASDELKPPQDIGANTQYLIGILLISATLGILFRTAVRLFRNQVVYWDDVINELTVGLLLAFSFLLLYLIGGLLYQGDALDISPESFRRVATAVSVLGLASAFLLEAAVVEIRRRFGQILRR